MTKKILPGNPGAERQAHLRSYLVACIRDNFASKADLASFDGLRRLQRTITEDLRGALLGIGLTPAAARELATEAVGAALAKKAVNWLFDKVGGGR